ncbi:hypothetical protein [Kribbella sp. VKM Ac-2568]|uniref:hypothetical protein n=1 Tax=Kribbella sp. VKM Ac-2568 TaxID=2512219 RepID=UPI00104B6ABA|nr:hypothetical protein [Kribbella sp. VKM Ac-2568]TCM39644.1 hypothetical protein EV648_114166 [Kribbella sp. VKM Ac-2568]
MTLASSGPLRPLREDSSVVDATFEINTVVVFDIVYHHKAGGRGSDRSVNADYHEGLELLLSRLISLRLTILGIAVDSSVARAIPVDERELRLDFPIYLPGQDAHLLRRDITRAQKSIARRKDAKPGGGNDQKRIVITIADSQGRLTAERLRTVLLTGRDQAATEHAVSRAQGLGAPIVGD